MSKKDIRYLLSDFKDSIIQYNKNRKLNNGSIDYFSFKLNDELYKVYTPELAYILGSTKLNVINMETKKETTIKGIDFFDSYKDGYEQGKKLFNDEFKLDPNILYSEKAKYYVEDLHQHYFHTNHKGNFTGWGKVKKSYPEILTKKEVHKYGYFSGIVDEVDKLAHKHPNLFREFYKCNAKAIPPQPIRTETNDTKNVITEHFNAMDNNSYKYAFKIEQDFNVFINILTNHFEYKEYSLPENTIQLKRGCKTKLAATLGKIHSELGNVDKFSSDIEYFKIVKCLSHYTDLSNDELYKSLTRNRKDY